MTSYAPYQSLALEEPSEGRTTARAHRDMVRSQSPQNPLRQSNASVNSPKTNGGGRDSAKNDLTVDSLINKIDGILKQNQSPVKSQANPQRQSQNLGQPTPLNQVSDNVPFAAPGSRQSITPDNKAKKNDIFSKKVYDNPLWSNQPVMTNSIRVQTPKPSEKSYESFPPIRENPSFGPMTNPPQQPTDINNDMGDIRSRINNLENKIKTFGSPAKSNSDAYVTPRGPSVQPATRATSVYATPAPQEAAKRSSPYADRNIYRSPERQRSPSPKLDGEVTEQICQTIDNLIQTHLLSPSKTVPATKNFYTSPPQSQYSSATPNPLYKPNVPKPQNTYSSPKYEPYTKYEPSTEYRPYEPNDKYEPKTESRPAYEPYKPYESSTGYQPYEPRPAYESKYEPSAPYESKYYDHYSKYESIYDPKDQPSNKYEPTTESRPAYEPYKPYESSTGYQPYESRPAYEPYDSLKSYDNDYKPYSSGSYTPSNTDYDRSRPRYVRPLHRNSPPKYSSYNSNWSSPKMDYISPRTDYYNTDDIYSLLTTPVRGQPQDSTSTDKKLKKLTLKSKVSEEKDDHKHNERDALPLPGASKGRKAPKKGSSVPIDEKPLYNNGNIRKRNYKAGDLMSDDEFHAGGLQGDETPRNNYRSGELDDDSVDTEWAERDYEEQEERETEKERLKQKPKDKLRQSRISRDVPDDGKAWNMVHKLPSSVFEEEESAFDFTQSEPKTKQPATQTQKKAKAMLWTMDEPDVSQRGSVISVSDSVRRSQRKPVLDHVFDKAERGGY